MLRNFSRSGRRFANIRKSFCCLTEAAGKIDRDRLQQEECDEDANQENVYEVSGWRGKNRM